MQSAGKDFVQLLCTDIIIMRTMASGHQKSHSLVARLRWVEIFRMSQDQKPLASRSSHTFAFFGDDFSHFLNF